MIHLYASEASAALAAGFFLLCILLSAVGSPSWWPRFSSMEGLLGVVSCAICCRMLASGRTCVWPSGVDFTGRVALVTGAGSGVGYGCAEDLALHGWTVILAGDNLDNLLTARQRILRRIGARSSHHLGAAGHKTDAIAESAAGSSRGRVVVLGKLDLSSEESIREYAATVVAASTHYPVALLINAAGIMCRHRTYTTTNWPSTVAGDSTASSVPPFDPSTDVVSAAQKGDNGAQAPSPRVAPAPLERMLATNAVGPMLLTQLLLPVLEATATRTNVSSRVVNVASSCHTFLGLAWAGSTAFDPIDMIRGLERSGSAEPASLATGDFTWTNFVGYYGLSKLCVIWNTRLLARQVDSLRFEPETSAGSAAAGADASAAKAPAGAAPRKRTKPRTPVAAAGASSLKVFVACTHPGIITTHLYRELFPQWALDCVIYYPSLLVGKTWHEGAQSTLRAAVGTEQMVQGGYYMCAGEYGEESGVNCLSAHASNGVALSAYKQWLQEKIVDTRPRLRPVAGNDTAGASK